MISRHVLLYIIFVNKDGVVSTLNDISNVDLPSDEYVRYVYLCEHVNLLICLRVSHMVGQLG